jgi:O-antigen/teichoic acid export membrane protein
MKSIDNALYNIISNIIRVLIVSVISFVITGILVRKLGDELYGIIPLISSFNRYVILITIVLTASAGRFVSLSYFEKKLLESNQYYSTSFFGLLIISTIVFIVFYIFSFYLDIYFNFPIEYFTEVKIFFVFSVLALLFSSLLSIFNVPVFIKHSFYLNDLVSIISKCSLLILVYFFIENITLAWFGFSLFISSLISLSISYLISIKLISSLRIKIKYFSFPKLKEMGIMGLNAFINSLGIILYTSSDIIIVNILLGSIESGKYGIAVQCGMVVSLLGGSITRLLAPVLVQLIAQNKKDEIVDNIVRFTKLITVFTGYPFVVFVVFSKPILTFWLGESFENMSLLLICVVSNQLLHQSTSLSFTYFNMRNKLKIPAIMTFITGILNIIFSILIVKHTDLGIYGVALGTTISIVLKTIIFNVIYTSRLLSISPFLIWKSVLRGLYWPMISAIGILFFYNSNKIDTVFNLFFGLIILTILYLAGAFLLPFSKRDVSLVCKIAKLDKLFNNKLIKDTK